MKTVCSECGKIVSSRSRKKCCMKAFKDYQFNRMKKMSETLSKYGASIRHE